MPQARISVRVQPRARRDEITGERGDGVVLVKLTAPPVEGAANEALVRFLAGRARVRRGDVRVIRGERGRDKVVEFDGLDEATLRERLLAPG